MKAKKLIQTLAFGIAALMPSLACAQLHPLEGWQPGDHLLIPIIQYRIADFYANKKLMGLNLYNIQGESPTSTPTRNSWASTSTTSRAR